MESMDLADTSPLMGRTFISSTNNICKISRIAGEQAAIRCNWKSKPSEIEIQEFDSWIETIIGPSTIFNSIGQENEEANLKKWKESVRRTK